MHDDAFLERACPAGMTLAQWQQRLELAACYRLFDWLGWTEGIYNHITVRVPDEAGQVSYLINPYGLHYAEVTASNLVRVDHQGQVCDGSRYPVNAAGLVIHNAVHAARHDAHCVMHTHTTSVMAVSCKASGLRADNFYGAQLHGRVAYHAFEGVTTRADEGARLVGSLGEQHIMLLRNHGVLVSGASLPEAFSRLWLVQRACDVQLATDSMAGPNQPIAPEVLGDIQNHLAAMRPGRVGPGVMLFQGLLRRAGIRYDDLV